MNSFAGTRSLATYFSRRTSKKTGKSGWAPATRQGFYSKDTTEKDYLPRATEVVNVHLRRSRDRIGFYVMSPTETWEPHEDTFAVLEKVTPVSVGLVEQLVAEAQQNFGPAHDQIRRSFSCRYRGD